MVGRGHGHAWPWLSLADGGECAESCKTGDIPLFLKKFLFVVIDLAAHAVLRAVCTQWCCVLIVLLEAARGLQQHDDTMMVISDGGQK